MLFLDGVCMYCKTKRIWSDGPYVSTCFHMFLYVFCWRMNPSETAQIFLFVHLCTYCTCTRKYSIHGAFGIGLFVKEES